MYTIVIYNLATTILTSISSSLYDTFSLISVCKKEDYLPRLAHSVYCTVYKAHAY